MKPRLKHFRSIICVGLLAFSSDMVGAEVSATPLHSDSGVMSALMEHSSIFTDAMDQVWSNPALAPLRYGSSLTTVSALAHIASDYRGGSFRADTWLKNSGSTITGYAGYDNGRYRSGQVFETDDHDLVGPYLMFADGPGTLSKEIYTFGGSYMAHIGRWSVGVSAGYKAGLSYRSVDPRPKNVTGLLTINPAGSLKIAETYVVGAGVSYERYKQTNDLKFVSELGQNTVYHLTGLGNTYGRFDGTGTSTYYNGSSFGVQLGIMPVENGLFASADFSRMRLTNILGDFNNLPLAHTSTPRLSGAAGWRNSHWLLCAEGSWERRRGTENIFGDPVSGQYPQIGELTLYSRTLRSFDLSATMRRGGFTGSLKAGWHSWFEQHMSPFRQVDWQRVEATLTLQQQLHIFRSGYLGLKGDLSASLPLSSSITGVEPVNNDLRTVTDWLKRQSHINTTRRLSGGVEGESLFKIKKMMLGATASWHRQIDGVWSVDFGVKLVF